ncbi:hypothetical protein LTR37_005188 [Vermiconidia calcicola]|uniref:Uncharacterized protein n=1 Tax=Vermiconidia calcicola TaxID=1690605 RepID=A0ACC3NK09_9PEZI|nr:hypothetical protein LTR37_005188 [Vermiconidia calcicola]
MASYKTCFEVSPECPVELTTYGYAPALWANVILCVLFGLTGVLQIIFGVYYKTWTWAVTVSFGCLLEFAGYIGRILMHYNAWNGDAYQLQIISIILAPSFIAAGINLTLKHVVLCFEPRLSRIRPGGYTWIFITIDFSCIAVQAIGGGMAASADDTNNLKILEAGNHVIVAGIALQVLNLAVFATVAAEYALRLRKHRAELGSKLDYAKDKKFKAFVVALIVAFLAIFIRSIYRIPVRQPLSRDTSSGTNIS